jgi:Fe-S cluster assembly protein SufD
MKEPVFIKDLQFPKPVTPNTSLMDWTEVCADSTGQASGVAAAAMEFRLGENEHREWAFIQNLPAGAKAGTQIVVRLAKNARARLVLIQVGAEVSHVEVRAICEGPGSELEVRGLQNTQGQQKHSIHVQVIHEGPHSKSDLRVWCVGRDRGHSVFNGLVDIKPGAREVEAVQKNKNLMLSKTATMDTFPKLFIAHDEVKAAHGASVSTLDPDQLVYLQSRGIDLESAERMVIEGFVHQVVEGIESRELQEQLEIKLGLSARVEETQEWATS